MGKLRPSRGQSWGWNPGLWALPLFSLSFTGKSLLLWKLEDWIPLNTHAGCVLCRAQTTDTRGGLVGLGHSYALSPPSSVSLSKGTAEHGVSLLSLQTIQLSLHT